jgi:hypothetical protein
MRGETMSTTGTSVVFSSVGSADLAAGRTYVHDRSLDGDESLCVGASLEVCDEAGRRFAATVTEYRDGWWQLTFVH